MKYKAYFGIKYYEDQRNRDLIEAVAEILKKEGIETVCIARDIEKFEVF